MTQYQSVNVKLSNLQLNKLKSATKNATDVTLTSSSNMIGTNETSFPYNLLLTYRQVSSLRKFFANKSSVNIKLSKIQLSLSEIIQSGRFLGSFLKQLMKVNLSLMKNVLKPSAKSLLKPLGLTAAASAADAGILKKSEDMEQKHH